MRGPELLHYAEDKRTQDGWYRDGHKIQPVLLQDVIKLEVICPCNEPCDLKDVVDDIQAECFEGIGKDEIRDFPLEVDYRWRMEDELWLRPSYV